MSIKEAAVELFVGGRLALFGEHSDWAGGYRRSFTSVEKGHCLVVGTQQGLHATAEARTGTLTFVSSSGETLECEMEEAELLRHAREGGFFSYVAGTAYYMLRHFRVDGLKIVNHKTDLPVGKGLSSSAAVCVLVARAFNEVFSLQLTLAGTMECAYQGELVTPSRCGRMDQAVAYGRTPVECVFDGDQMHIEALPLPRNDVHLVIVDLKGTKDTKAILGALNAAYPEPRNEAESKLHELLGSTNLRIVEAAKKALADGDAEKLGNLMNEAQALFDDAAAPFCDELKAPKLHALLESPLVKKHCYGGKLVGSGGDGTAQLLAKSDANAAALCAALGDGAMRLTIEAGGKVRKAVIPCAGNGTRMRPASFATKKELFPIVQRGVAKPVIQIIVEEALSVESISEVCLIVQQKDLATFQVLFERLELASKVTFVIQDKQDGLGHAVLCASEFCGDEPFLLLLGDHIFWSADLKQSCASQLVAGCVESGLSAVGAVEMPLEALPHFGTLLLDEQGNVSRFVEKPSISYAEDHCIRWTVSGQYVFTPAIFKLLREDVANDKREKGEIQLTSAMERLRLLEGFIGLPINGKRFDVGMPDAYAQTVSEYAAL